METPLQEAQVLAALSQVQDPDLGRNIVDLGFVKNLKIEEGRVSFTLELTTPACPMKELMMAQAKDAVFSVQGVNDVQIHFAAKVPKAISFSKESLMPGVAHIIAVASGKGGVGKSTVAANLAIALSLSGAKVGLMDTDFYGPSIPLLLGSENPPEAVSETMLAPAEKFGVKVVSMAYFLPREKAVIWRGPMLHRMIRQFAENVNWGEIDYLFVDLPPGTGDVQLSLCQTIRVTGAVVVTTPQDLALTVASKAIALFKELQVPILGIIENMSGYTCPHCGKQDEIFGHGGAQRISKELGYPFLGAIPLSTEIRKQSDLGHPVALLESSSPWASYYLQAARELAAQISIVSLRNRPPV